jgi:hypothetical protein
MEADRRAAALSARAEVEEKAGSQGIGKTYAPDIVIG